MNNKGSTQILLLLVFGTLVSCGPTKMGSTWTKPDYQDKKYSKIAVVGIGEDLESRRVFERNAVVLLNEQGINAIEGIGVFPPKTATKILTAEDYIKIINDNNLDGVITMALVDSKESERYESGETISIPAYYRVGKYIVRGYQHYETPGYYTPIKSFLIEAVLYNVKGELYEGKETMVWTGQSSLVDPSSMKLAATSFTKKMVNQLVADEIITAK